MTATSCRDYGPMEPEHEPYDDDENAYLDRLDVLENGPGIVEVDIQVTPEPPGGASRDELIAAIAAGADLTMEQAVWLVAFHDYCVDEGEISDYWLDHARDRIQLKAVRRARAFILDATPPGEIAFDDELPI